VADRTTRRSRPDRFLRLFDGTHIGKLLLAV
jgi:hypothetical protein